MLTFVLGPTLVRVLPPPLPQVRKDAAHSGPAGQS